MSRGFHAFFRQYYNLRGLLRRTDPGLSTLTPLPDYPLRHADGRRDSFRASAADTAVERARLRRAQPHVRLRDLAAMDARAARCRCWTSRCPRSTSLDDISATTFLERDPFPEAARHLAFEVFSRSFFADPRELSAAELALMFHIYFLGSAEGLLFDVPNATSRRPCGTRWATT